ncbi:MAG: hypothetical protein IJ493_12975 [Clostridia bacterium]|nr:hypothetical protein [Clostridia bacterium]
MKELTPRTILLTILVYILFCAAMLIPMSGAQTAAMSLRQFGGEIGGVQDSLIYALENSMMGLFWFVALYLFTLAAKKRRPLMLFPTVCAGMYMIVRPVWGILVGLITGVFPNEYAWNNVKLILKLPIWLAEAGAACIEPLCKWLGVNGTLAGYILYLPILSIGLRGLLKRKKSEDA